MPLRNEFWGKIINAISPLEAGKAMPKADKPIKSADKHTILMCFNLTG
jgi:hypothetical protein